MVAGRLLSSFPKEAPFRRNLRLVYLLLAILNLGAWGWALALFHDNPASLGLAAVVYGLGLRHAIDADHIAAIDNVTRKLMQDAQRPVSVGFWFAIGHSLVVIIVTVIAVMAASRIEAFKAFQVAGGTLSTMVSAVFLFAVAAMNISILISIIRALRKVRSGGDIDENLVNGMFSGGGPLFRFFAPLFRCIRRPWHIAPLGFLFGLSFDTATEVTLFGLSAAQVPQGASLEAALVFPALFAAGMSLLDTTDGVMMVGAYNWAFLKPARKLYYNMTITVTSIAIALFVGGLEVSSLLADRLKVGGALASALDYLSESFNRIGVAMVALFACSWIASSAVFGLMERRSKTARAVLESRSG